MIDEIGKDFHFSSFSFDVDWMIKILVTDRTIVLDGGHSYDIVETEDGYEKNY